MQDEKQCELQAQTPLVAQKRVLELFDPDLMTMMLVMMMMMVMIMIMIMNMMMMIIIIIMID